MKLHELSPPTGSTRPKRRVGRGIGGKGGKTAGRGTKGQGARDTIPAGFEGGQLPLIQRIPKLKGFKNPFRVEYTPVNLDDLAAFEADEVTAELLVAQWPGPQGRAGQGARPRGADRAGPGVGACVLGLGARRHRGRRWHRRSISRCRSATAVRRLGAMPSPTGSYRRAGVDEESPCSPGLGNIFRVPDLRNKVLFTLLIIALYQLGANVPVPGSAGRSSSSSQAEAGSSGVLGFLNLFSGGALVRAGRVRARDHALHHQLDHHPAAGDVIPKLEEWRDQGAVGQKKITQTTRYLTVALALMQSTGLVFVFHGHGSCSALGSAANIDLIPSSRLQLGAFIVLILTAGTAFVMWLGELITQRGIGSGMSILIFANVVASIPSGGKAIYEEGGALKFAIMILVSLLLLVVIVFMEPGPAADPGDLRQTCRRAPHVRRPEHLHPAEGQPVRRHPDHLRQLAALHPGAAEQRDPVALGFQNFVKNNITADEPGLHLRRTAS